MSKCPSKKILRDFSTGELGEPSFGETLAHVSGCKECQQLLSQLDTDDDEVIQALSKPRTKYLSEPGLAHARLLAEQVTGRESSTVVPGRVGPFRLKRTLGQGAMGAVYEALDERTGERCALKLLVDNAVPHQPTVTRFEREAEIVIKLRHKNVVSAFDSGCDANNVQYLAMELLEGIDLSALIDQQQQLSIPDACEIVRQMACGLEYIDECGLIHRDIKPSNTMLVQEPDSQCSVKILDLGLAMVAEFFRADGGRLTATDQQIGTVDYMAPEQGRNASTIDVRADIYGLGATLYKLLTGKAPFEADQPISVLEKLRFMAQEEPFSVSSRREEIPQELAEIVHRLIARDPINRPQRPGKVVELLEPYCLGADLPKLLRDACAVRENTRRSKKSSSGRINHSHLPSNIPPEKESRRTWLAVAGVSVSTLFAISFSIWRSQKKQLPGSSNRAKSSDSAKVQTIRPSRFLEGHSNNVFGILFVPQTTNVVSSSWDGTLRCWNAATGESVWTSKSPRSEFLVSIAISPDGQIIATGTPQQRVYLWSASTGGLIQTLIADDVLTPLSTLGFSQDGTKLTCISDSGVVLTFDTVTGEIIGRFAISQGRKRMSYLESSDSLIIGAKTMGPELVLLNSNGTVLRQFREPPLSCDALTVIDRNRILIASASGSLKGLSIWNLETGERESHLATDFPIEDLSVTRDFRFAAIGTHWRDVKIYDLKNMQLVCEGQTETQATQRVGISDDGRLAVSGGGWRVNQRIASDGDFRLRVWPVEFIRE